MSQVTSQFLSKVLEIFYRVHIPFTEKNKKGKKERAATPIHETQSCREFGGEQEALERVVACVDRWHGGEVGDQSINMCEGEGGQGSPVLLVCQEIL